MHIRGCKFIDKKDNEVLLLNLIENTQILTNFFNAQPEDVFIFLKLNVRRNLTQKSF